MLASERGSTPPEGATVVAGGLGPGQGEQTTGHVTGGRVCAFYSSAGLKPRNTRGSPTSLGSAPDTRSHI